MRNFKLVICSGKGGVGKSMLAAGLIILFAKEKRVTGVDCDVDAPNLSIWLGGVKKWDKTIKVFASLKPEIDYSKCNLCGLCVKNCRFKALSFLKGKIKLNPFLCENCGACEVICPQKAIRLKAFQNGEIRIKKIHKKGSQEIVLISGSLFPGETGSGKVVTEIKKQADRFESDLQIIDSAPGTSCPVIASLQDADFAVLITEPTPSGFSDLKKVLKVVNHFNVPWNLVINKWDINPSLTQKIKNWASQKLLGQISYDKKIIESVSFFRPILETDLKAKKEIEKIFKRLKCAIQSL